MRDFVSMGVAGAHGKTSTTGMLSHVLSHITDTSFLIGDGTGRGSANAKYFVFESDKNYGIGEKTCQRHIILSELRDQV